VRRERHEKEEETMPTLELTEDELRILQAALHSYLDDFGHEEADVLRTAKALLAKLRDSS
jgi:hypothetical protein